MYRSIASITAALTLAAVLPVRAAGQEGVPRYDHVFVIVEENKDYDQILDPAAAPNIAGLAKTYGNATSFYGEVHPSEANYVALLGGDTFGIHDDDAYYCKAGSARPFCDGAMAAEYADHTVRAQHLGDQLAAAGLTWKGYYETLPQPGSLAVVAGDPRFDNGTRQTALYASKHSGFMNFADVQVDPHRAERIVGFDQLDRDIASGALPAFALIVPNQCNEMHGLSGDGVPADCQGSNKAALIRRGDAYTGELVRRIQATQAWAGRGNFAIVITFDEGAGKTREGCCAVTPDASSNFGGGHIPTIVITNHGVRGVRDDTAYNHYSLLRTIEDAFGLSGHLGHAADTDKGVRDMAPLFATGR
ncbi:alkaline phosphatase family protein [Phenylobacterium sp.]|uniref:alkaline phosphatase family protein n=1 Tax=Phenylobacterium sp. TaxID=1871053 RepID=UPI0012184B54|nr:alkaline phosphatase family protein [Phenylobacterium sp.]THD58466.1 MAG: phosphoesterase [Phenylobacterium sp.]